MPYTEFFVTKGVSVSDVNGGGIAAAKIIAGVPTFGAGDGPNYACGDATAVNNGVDSDITDNTVSDWVAEGVEDREDLGRRDAAVLEGQDEAGLRGPVGHGTEGIEHLLHEVGLDGQAGALRPVGLPEEEGADEAAVECVGGPDDAFEFPGLGRQTLGVGQVHFGQRRLEARDLHAVRREERLDVGQFVGGQALKGLAEDLPAQVHVPHAPRFDDGQGLCHVQAEFVGEDREDHGVPPA